MKTYLFDSTRLYSKDSLESEVVVPMTLVCHNVKPAGRNFMGDCTWEFQIVGQAGWYRTSYAGNLVFNTKENLELVKARDLAWKDSVRLEKQVNLLNSQVLTIGSPNQNGGC